MREHDPKKYYRILGVSASAPASEIRTSFRNLAKQYHPDRNSDPKAAQRFRSIHEAYEVLGNAERRARYDGSSYESRHRGQWHFGVAAFLLLLAAPMALLAYFQFEPLMRAITNSLLAYGNASSRPPTCDEPPLNGEVLEDNTNWTQDKNAIEIQNRSGRDAIVKIRDSASGKTLISF